MKVFTKNTLTKEQFLEFYNKGLSDRKISITLNISKWWVRKMRCSLNLPRMSMVSQYKNEIENLVAQGKSDIAISKELKISHSMIGYIRKCNNIKTNFIERIYPTKEDRIKGYIIRNVKYSSKRRNLEFNLDYKDITLPKYCPLLEVPLQYKDRDFNNMFFPTVDRIDNKKGYIKGNVIVMSRLANVMKSEANFEQLRNFSKNINKLINFYENQDARGNITDIFYKNEELSLDS